MALLALFTPEEAETWRVRLFPTPPPFPILGLDPAGECVGVALGHAGAIAALDLAMMQRRAGYQKRLHANGVMEITTTADAAAEALCQWVAGLIAATSKR